MQRKSVTEERAETWKANERREIIIMKKSNVRLAEFVYIVNIFLMGVMLMNDSYLLAFINFIGAVFGRSGFFYNL